MLGKFEGQTDIKQWLVLIVIVTAVIVFEITLNKEFIGSDDAYIHLRYIDNFRRDQGFGFNPNQPSYGDTSPLWVVFASFVAQGASNLPQSVRLLSILLFAFSAAFFYLIILDVSSSKNLALLSTIVYASDPWLLKWAGSAMESSLAVVLILLSAMFILRLDKPLNSIVAPALLGLATLCRPEVALLFFIFLVLHLMIGKSTLSMVKSEIISILVYGGVLSPWLIFSYGTFGTLIPNTFLAKTVASEANIWQVGWYFLRVIALSYWWAWIAISIFVIKRIIKQNPKQWIASFPEVKDKTIILFGIWSFVLPLYYSVSKLQTPSTRYLQLTTPLLLLASIYGINQVFRNFSIHSAKRRSFVLATSLVGIVLYNVLVNALVVLPSNLDFTSGILQTYRGTGEWLSINTDKDSQIAIAIDVGTIGYYSNRDIVDLGGLNTREVISYLPDNLEYVFVSKPEYLIITGESDQYSLVNNPRFEKIAQPVFSLPMDVGIRANFNQLTGGGQQIIKYATIYQLFWP